MAKVIAEGIAPPVVQGMAAPTHDEIAERAYFIYKARGGQHGLDVDDWLQAEAELFNERAVARARD